MNIKFEPREHALLQSLDFSLLNDDVSHEQAEQILDAIVGELQAYDEVSRNVAEDIITKITTHPEW